MDFVELWNEKAKIEQELKDLRQEVEHIKLSIGRVIDILIELKDGSTIH